MGKTLIYAADLKIGMRVSYKNHYGGLRAGVVTRIEAPDGSPDTLRIELGRLLGLAVPRTFVFTFDADAFEADVKAAAKITEELVDEIIAEERAAKPISYADRAPKGWCGDPGRGAALGRHKYHAKDPEAWNGRLLLSRIPLDAGGYDPLGTYFGTGVPLYWCRSDCGTVDYVFRAADRGAARQQALTVYPRAKIKA